MASTRRFVPLALLFLALGSRPARAEVHAPLALTPPALLTAAPDSGPARMEGHLLRTQALCAAGTHLVGSTALLALGTWVGRSSNSLPVVAPPLLAFLLAPSFATTWAAWEVGSRSQQVDVRYLTPAFAALGAHVLTSVAGILLGVSTARPLGMLAFTLVDTVVTGGTAIAVMDLLAPARTATPAALPTVSPAPAPAASPAPAPAAAPAELQPTPPPAPTGSAPQGFAPLGRTFAFPLAQVSF